MLSAKAILNFILAFVFALAFILVILFAQPKHKTTTQASVLTAVPMNDSDDLTFIRMADPEVAFMVSTTLGWTLAREAVQTNNDVRYVEFPVVSSGEKSTVTLTTLGHPVLDTLIVYAPTKAGVIQMPIPIGYLDQGQYLFFDATITEEDAHGITRLKALQEIQQKYPRGQVLTLTLFKYISLDGVDWLACIHQETALRLASGCRLAQAYNENHPNAERLFISKVPTEGDWFPVGWWFAPYFEDLQVSLP